MPESIATGDTLRVFNGAQEVAVQLCGTEVSELGRPLGIESRDALREMVDQGDERIVLVPVTTESNGLLVAEAFISLTGSEEELHPSAQLVTNGLASVAETVEVCPNADALLKAEALAKS
ncbi:MAG: thermonuclease family protein, partial [Cyanobacteria bacterium J06576_12]